MKVKEIVVLSIVLIGLSPIFYKPVFSYDVWIHLKMGEFIVKQDYHLPESDPFSQSTKDSQLVHHEWLSQLALYWTHHIFGFSGIRTMRVILILAALVLVFRAAFRMTGRLSVSLLALLVTAYLFRTRYLIRPELFSLVLLPFFYYRLFISREQMGRLAYFGLFILLVLWVNLHPFMLFIGFVIVLLVVARMAKRLPWAQSVFSFPDRSYDPVILLLLFLAASLINPQSYEIYGYVFHATPLVARYIREWQSVFIGLQSEFFKAVSGGVLAFPVIMKGLVIGIPGFFLIVLVLSYARRVKWSLEDLFLGLWVSYMAVKSARFVWLLFIPLLLIVKYGARLAEQDPVWEKIKPGGTICLRMALAVALLYWIGQGYQRIPYHFSRQIEDHRYPEGPVNIIKQANLSGRLYNPNGWGGYLIYHLYPHHKPFIDTRSHLHGETRLVEAKMIQYQYPGFEALIRKYAFDILLLEKMYGGSRPFTSQDWILLFEDSRCAMYLRRNERNAENLSRVIAYFNRNQIPFDPERGFQPKVLPDPDPL